MNQWKFVGTPVDERNYVINGVNVWAHKWQEIEDETAHVQDPHYSQDFQFDVYIIEHEEQRVKFAAGEFSNGVWGFYVPDETDT
jgi:hypothetical protein